MTVQELIYALNKVEDKSRRVVQWDESDIYEITDNYSNITLD